MKNEGTMKINVELMTALLEGWITEDEFTEMTDLNPGEITPFTIEKIDYDWHEDQITYDYDDEDQTNYNDFVNEVNNLYEY